MHASAASFFLSAADLPRYGTCGCGRSPRLRHANQFAFTHSPTENAVKPKTLAAISGLVLLLLSQLALADYDPRDEQEAKAFAARSREAAQKEAVRKQKLEADRSKAEADMYRKALGAQTNGKSDAEVIAMMKAQQAAAIKLYGQPAPQGSKPQNRTTNEEQANLALRKATGNKSVNMEDLAKMSDAELEAMARKAAKGQ
jgi:hypothetical protein